MEGEEEFPQEEVIMEEESCDQEEMNEENES